MNISHTKKYNAEQVFKDSPTLVGVVGGVQFYEHPKFGDDYPLIAYDRKTKEMVLSTFWELPALNELFN